MNHRTKSQLSIHRSRKTWFYKISQSNRHRKISLPLYYHTALHPMSKGTPKCAKVGPALQRRFQRTAGRRHLASCDRGVAAGVAEPGWRRAQKAMKHFQEKVWKHAVYRIWRMQLDLTRDTLNRCLGEACLNVETWRMMKVWPEAPRNCLYCIADPEPNSSIV